MADGFASGRIIDGILLLMMLEWGMLMLLQRKLPNAVSATALAPTLAAGAALLMALRAALTGVAWTGIAPWLLVALCAHAVDLVRRLKNPGTASRG